MWAWPSAPRWPTGCCWAPPWAPRDWLRGRCGSDGAGRGSRRRSGKKRDFPAAGGQDEDAFPVKIVISGYYGFGNAGDEAILEAMVRDLGRCAGGPAGGALGRPGGDGGSLRCRSRAPDASPSDAGGATRADLFISGGGSLLQDATSWRSVPYYAGLMRLARWMGVPVFVYAQGIGPLRRPWLRRLAGPGPERRRRGDGARPAVERDAPGARRRSPRPPLRSRRILFSLWRRGPRSPSRPLRRRPTRRLAGAAASGGAPAGPAASGGPAVSTGRRGDALGPQGGRLIGLCLRPFLRAGRKTPRRTGCWTPWPRPCGFAWTSGTPTWCRCRCIPPPTVRCSKACAGSWPRPRCGFKGRRAGGLV